MESTLPAISYNDLLDAVEVQMREKGTIHIEPIHVFTPGLYTRSIIVDPNTYLLSKIHKQEHQFILSSGQIVVYTENGGMVLLTGPYLGVTDENTRRFAKTLTRCVWTSIHQTDIQPVDDSEEALKYAVSLVEEQLYAKHENIFLIKMEEAWQE